MKISFLVTYYQQERYVRESLDSILALEKPPEWEILIGDDGSRDGTVAAARAYCEQDPEHIRLFVMDRDPEKTYHPVERASACRLNLLRRMTGDCWCLMDGDDFYSETDFIPKALSVLEAHPKVSVVALDTWKYQEGQPRRASGYGSEKTDFVPVKRYLRWQYTHAGACVFRKTHTPEDLNRLEALGFFDDNDIVLSALTRGEMVRIREPVYAYRQAAGSVYTVMQPAEQAALNVAGLGAALRIMGPEWERDVLARYASAVWMAWFLRKKLPESLDAGKYERYLTACRRTAFSEGEQLLCYPRLTPEERRGIRKWVLRAGRESPLRIAWAWKQVFLRGRKP